MAGTAIVVDTSAAKAISFKLLMEVSSLLLVADQPDVRHRVPPIAFTAK